MRDPAWLPHLYDASGGSFVFAYAPREVQRRAVFLDPRFLRDTPISAPIAVRDLPLGWIREAAQPVHFIFHTAFCCSTLLTRALDVPGIAMGLKEPSVLVTLCGVPRKAREADTDALDIAVDLLSRPLAPGERQIVKPSNAANEIAPAIMELRPSAKAIVLYSDLAAYLRSTARMGMSARAFNRNLFTQLVPVMPLKARFTAQELLMQTDLQIAAQVWLMQAAFLDALAKRFGPTRVRALKSSTLLSDKAQTLTSLGRFFGLDADAPLWSAIAAGPVFDRHAKSFGEEPFDPTNKDNVDTVHAREVSAVLPWAEALAAHCGVPLDLGGAIFD